MNNIFQQIYDKKNKMYELRKELRDLGCQLIDKKVHYNGHDGIVEYVDVDESEAVLLLNDGEYSWNEFVGIYELEEMIKYNKHDEQLTDIQGKELI